jgi:hypothetical protein
MNNRNVLLFLLPAILIFLAGFSEAQVVREKKLTSFGIQFSPVFPNKLFQRVERERTEDSILYRLKDIPAYMFGMEVRHDFTKHLSMQTGINFIRRNYEASITTGDSAFMKRLHFIGYEVPLLALGYVRLGRFIYLDGSFGASLNFYPSDISIPHFYGLRDSWMTFSLLTNTGIEFRTEKSGYFYLGTLYQWHFKDMMHVLFFKGYNTGTADSYLSAQGNYFAVNLKYYFPQNKQKKQIP